MKTLLSYIDLVIECRDYRVPLTSRNPLFEAELAGKQRLILYTKQDLGSSRDHESGWQEREVTKAERPNAVLFADNKDKDSTRRVLKYVRRYAVSRDSLSGSRIMVVGMPNVGKSSLLNALRQIGVHKGKAARTGDQPGVTRKIGTTVKILEGQEGSQDVYLVDTPGVFIPYVPDTESMLKLALCGSVKDSIIPYTTLADYLLFHLNLQNPSSYSQYFEPTNDINELLEAVATKTGRLQKGGTPDLEASALWIIQRWRNGQLGKFILDDLSPESIERSRLQDGSMRSLSQGRKEEKNARRIKNAAAQKS